MAKFDGLLIGQYKKNAGGIELTGIVFISNYNMLFFVQFGGHGLSQGTAIVDVGRGG